MVDIAGVTIEPDNIVHCLKKTIQIRDVAQRILYQQIIRQAAESRGITVSPAEIEAEADALRYAKRLEKASDTLNWLTTQMITVEDWEAGIYDRLLAKKVAEALFAPEVDKFFAENRLDFEQILLYHLIVPYEQVAQELFYQIEESEISFYEAAHLYDVDDRRRYVCGYEGKVNRWSLSPEIAAAIFSANIGQVVGPLKTEQGYHLFWAEEFIPATLTPEHRQEIQHKLFQDWLNQELNYLLNQH
jgi:parvulin-like peptidyl-prolyl isomerase